MNVCMAHPCQRTTGGCPICDPPRWPAPYTVPMTPVFQPMGCICPPTSEQTCQSLICPRKSHLKAAGSLATPNGNGKDAA